MNNPLIECYSDQKIEFSGPSIFLAGPTPRCNSIVSWRIEAIRILYDMRFSGTVLIPEQRTSYLDYDYNSQVEWEFYGLEHASVIAFWVPRQIELLPGFTTNVEFGRYVSSGRIVYGRPVNCPHNRYLDWMYEKFTSQSPHADLISTISSAVTLANSKN